MRRILTVALMAIVSSLVAPAALAVAISQGYQASGDVSAGTLVSIQPAKNDVVAADTTNSNGLLGVVVGATASSLAVNSQASLVQVATSGTAQLFVSDINGAVQPGDQIAPSPIKGVGMKASASGKVVGIAQSGFSGQPALKSVTVKTTGGASQTAHIGVIQAVVQVVYYTVPAKTVLPAYVQQVVQAVGGKPITAARLVLVGVILVAAMVVVGFLMFSAVQGSIISIGRNPLAKTSIYRGVFQAAATSMIILIVAVAGAYIVLRY